MVAVHAPISNLCEQRRARNARATGSSGQRRPSRPCNVERGTDLPSSPGTGLGTLAHRVRLVSGADGGNVLGGHAVEVDVQLAARR